MTLAFNRNDRRTCSRCGLPLEDPASEERGTGPVCAAKDTVLFARSIPANFAGATAVLLSIKPEMLPASVMERYQGMYDALLKRAEKATQRNDDSLAIHLPGQDLRQIIKDIDWILSHRMDDQVRRFFVKIVKFLGYKELAGVLSQEASTTAAKVWFDASVGSVFLLGKSCKMGYWAMRQIPGIKTPRRRGSEEPYTAPASEVGKFLEVVQEFWPMYESDLEAVRQEATQWHVTNAAKAAMEAAKVNSFSPTATMQFKTLTGFDAGTWIDVSFPWVTNKKAEMYAIVEALKGQIRYQDRRYNPVTKTWTIKVAHQAKIEAILGKLFKIEVLPSEVG